MEAPIITVTFTKEQYDTLVWRLETFSDAGREVAEFDEEIVTVLKKYTPKSNEERIGDLVTEIMKKKYEIIDLFTKTFLAVQDYKTPEQLRYLFECMELHCIQEGFGHEIFRFNLRNTTDMKGPGFKFQLIPREINDNNESKADG